MTATTSAAPQTDTACLDGRQVRIARYRLNPDIHFDDFLALLPVETWQPGSNPDADWSVILPKDWERYYYDDFKQAFEPSRFYLNCVLVCNASRAGRVDPEMAAAIIGRLIEQARRYSDPFRDALFCRYDFPFPREGYQLSSGWTSAIGNGFILRGILRAHLEFPALDLLPLADRYAAAYSIINTGGSSRPWFSYLGDDGYLWFDEYPADDGLPTLVLNGHIHAMHGLTYYVRARPGAGWAQLLLQAGLATMRHNAERFRVPGKVNRYSLREPSKKDYLPSRTVRQQKELWMLTGDRWFKALSETFGADIAAAAKRAQP